MTKEWKVTERLTTITVVTPERFPEHVQQLARTMFSDDWRNAGLTYSEETDADGNVVYVMLTNGKTYPAVKLGSGSHYGRSVTMSPDGWVDMGG